MADSHKNFAYSLVATAPSPATSGTSLVVTTGEGTNFPTPPFNATIWPTVVQPTSANSEIVRVTAISGDTLTITRQQESTSARTVIVGDQISGPLTSKTLTDVENVFNYAKDNYFNIPSGDVFSISSASFFDVIWLDATVTYDSKPLAVANERGGFYMS